MATNGELRFRLNCTDGSAYIRTQTSPDTQGWQNPHFHKRVRETYVVGDGWIGYAELRDGRLVKRSYAAGHVFTTEPGIVHNIFMPAGAVIHTVKHGADTNPGQPSDWYGGEKYPDTVLLAKLHGTEWSGSTPTAPLVTESGAGQQEVRDPEQTYNAAYRHFDTLIWQAPTWSSTLFTLVVASVNSLLTKKPDDQVPPAKETVNAVANILGFTTNQFAAAQLTIFGVFTCVLAYALYRFRWHQLAVKSWSRTPSSPKISPQVLLQLVITVEAGILLLVACALAGWPRGASAVGILLTLGCINYSWESTLAKRQNTLHPPTRRASDPVSPAQDQGGS